MKRKTNFFVQTLITENHREFVLTPSIQYNFYDKITDEYNWMSVLSIKFLFWEVGVVFRDEIEEKQKTKFHHGIGNGINFLADEPNEKQTTSVPEKTIYDV